MEIYFFKYFFGFEGYHICSGICESGGSLENGAIFRLAEYPDFGSKNNNKCFLKSRFLEIYFLIFFWIRRISYAFRNLGVYIVPICPQDLSRAFASKRRHFQARTYPDFGSNKKTVFFSNRDFWKFIFLSFFLDSKDIICVPESVSAPRSVARVTILKVSVF